MSKKQHEYKYDIKPTVKSNLDLFSFNQSAVAQLPTIDDLKSSIASIKEYIKDTNNTFYLLYSKTAGYFTLFTKEKQTNDSFETVMTDVLTSIGEIKSADITEDKAAVEIWAIPVGQTIPDCYYFFAFDKGLCELGEM